MLRLSSTTTKLTHSASARWRLKKMSSESNSPGKKRFWQRNDSLTLWYSYTASVIQDTLLDLRILESLLRDLESINLVRSSASQTRKLLKTLSLLNSLLPSLNLRKPKLKKQPVARRS